MNLVENYKIDNLKEIQSELLDYLNNNTKNIYVNKESGYSYMFVPSYHILNLPCLNETLKQTFAIKPSIFKFYIMPPGAYLKPHMDGTTNTPSNSFGYNIPLYNCDSVETIFYSCDPINITWKAEKGQNARLPIDESQLIEIKRHIIDQPSFMSTNTMHSVRNNTNDNRIVFLMRWMGVRSQKEVLKL